MTDFPEHLVKKRKNLQGKAAAVTLQYCPPLKLKLNRKPKLLHFAVTGTILHEQIFWKLRHKHKQKLGLQKQIGDRSQDLQAKPR